MAETKTETKRCCRTCDHCNIPKKECYEGGHTDIGDLDLERSEENCCAWTERPVPIFPRRSGDQLFPFEGEKSELFRCGHCNWKQSTLWVLAANKDEADLARAEGSGLCGNCMCELIDDTHAEVVTQEAFCYLDAEDFWKGTVDIRHGEMEDSHDFYFRGISDFEQAKAYAEEYARKFYDIDEDEEISPNPDGWWEEPMSGRWYRLGRLKQIKTLEELFSCLYIETVPTPTTAA